ncbi:aprataxin [Trichonephila inaurata madagascariensis]|uniref:Aprataxin n=1 Tax=Trichonephila inaurata madagascariensis TaxID=2747483 RepID=A0A8X6YMK6_9ARAC|nr:aprataxin [Trichonephila inaurata madagascariensis]
MEREEIAGSDITTNNCRLMALKRENENSSNNAKKSKIGHWSQGLKASMEDPNLIVDSDDLIVIIKDKYPKAQHHYLILPKQNIPNLKSVSKDYLSLLKHMHEKAEELIAKSNNKHKFQIGYHAVPSMSHLHLHVISQDFDSPCLKTKTHWNSFTSEYFISSKSIMKQLETDGKIKLMDPNASKELLKQSLRCHVCKKELPTMPKLKDHIKVCVNKLVK